MKKTLHPLISGTLLLTAAGLTTRLIGFFYKEDELSFLSSKKGE